MRHSWSHPILGGLVAGSLGERLVQDRAKLRQFRSGQPYGLVSAI